MSGKPPSAWWPGGKAELVLSLMRRAAPAASAASQSGNAKGSYRPLAQRPMMAFMWLDRTSRRLPRVSEPHVRKERMSQDFHGPPKNHPFTGKNDLGSTFHNHSTMYIFAICGINRSSGAPTGVWRRMTQVRWGSARSGRGRARQNSPPGVRGAAIAGWPRLLFGAGHGTPPSRLRSTPDWQRHSALNGAEREP